MKTVTDHLIISDRNSMTLSERVKGAINAQGWEPLGGVVTCEGLKGITFTQTMVKYSDVPPAAPPQKVTVTRPAAAPVKNPNEDSAIEF